MLFDGFYVCIKFFCTLRYMVRQRAYVICDDIIYIYELREDSDEKLFFLSRYNHNHVLHRLLPQPKNTGYNLRQRTHDLTLPTDINAVTKQNIVYRMLFRDIY